MHWLIFCALPWYHGTVVLAGSTLCKCKEGFGGRNCGTKCPKGWSGVHCDVDLNECASAPCHYGHCEESFQNISVPIGEFQCKCFEGWSGLTCNICEDDPSWKSRCAIPWYCLVLTSLLVFILHSQLFTTFSHKFDNSDLQTQIRHVQK